MSNAKLKTYQDLPSLKELKTPYFLENVQKFQFALFGYYLYLLIETYKIEIGFANDHRKQRLRVAVSNVFFTIQRRHFYLDVNFI
jgi:hypothetical protein